MAKTKLKPVEIFIRPLEPPYMAIDDGANVRIYYEGSWVTFRDGEVVVKKDTDS